ncbi:polysaccharide deacetylase family protein [Agathobaculum sp.]|uniref:polysaccharide deacetylase family protein n=1 Tax=Agathobaculum sp. TaxID=2048138 RepID=UPI002A811CCE|nr:polysaccharide deacetylase family protein [Agathobaculum sp.]MDY3618262.1 polysaccharide deacetylase family protein [Agathobaculum sp.]
MFITITRDTIYRIAAAAGVCVLLAVLLTRLPGGGDDTAQAVADAEEAIPTAVSDWGLSFQTEGQPPVGNVSADTLKQWNAYYVGDTSKPKIYITFDAGFENGNTPAILDALKKHNAPACFFLVGNYIDTAPDLVKRMVEEGHTVGNHTMHHPDMSKIADQAAFEQELNGLADKFKELTGQELPKFYRPPQGKFSEENLKQAQELGYTTVFWSLAYVDWYTDNQPSDEQAYAKLLPRIHNGAIVLLHSTSETNARILDELLTKWEDMGYTFGSLNDLAG